MKTNDPKATAREELKGFEQKRHSNTEPGRSGMTGIARIAGQADDERGGDAGPESDMMNSPPRTASSSSVMSIDKICHAEDVEIASIAGMSPSLLAHLRKDRGTARGTLLDALNTPSRTMERRKPATRSIDGSPYSHMPLLEEERRCTHCGTHETPSWRRNSHGLLLCNACGLYERINREPRRFIFQDGVLKTRRKSSAVVEDRFCANCATNQTPMWRKIMNVYYCNACAIFYRTNGYHRPKTEKAWQPAKR